MSHGNYFPFWLTIVAVLVCLFAAVGIASTVVYIWTWVM